MCLARRGGNWNNGSNAGVFALYLYRPRSSRVTSFGFRPAYIPDI